VDQYIDEGKSGTQVKRRNDYQRLLSDIEENKFDIIVVKAQDRLQRNTKDWYIFVDKLVSNHKKLFLYLENKFFTPADDALITGIKAILAEEYSRDLSKKLNNSAQRRIEKVRNGEKVSAMGTSMCYGYYIKDGEWLVDHEQAKIAKLMYELYLKYDSIRKVANALNEMGYRNQKGGTFCSDSIARVLKNPRYKGTLVVNRFHRNFEEKKIDKLPQEEWVTQDNAFEAVIDPETWRIVNERLAAKRGSKRGKKVSRDPMGGKLFCAECGSVLYRHKSNKYYSWYCSNRMTRGNSVCVGTSLSEYNLRSILKNISSELKVDKKAVKKSMLEWLNNLKASLSSGTDTTAIERDLEKLKGKKEKLTEAYLEEIISKEDYKKKYSALEKQIADLENSLIPVEENEDIRDVEKIIENIDTELDQWMSTDAFEDNKVDFLMEHTKKITVCRDKHIIIELDLIAGAIIAGKDFLLFVHESMSFPDEPAHLSGSGQKEGT
jgi:DNA invertase Pin-like site-specific DNA recombinase